MLTFVDFTKTAKTRSTYGSLRYNNDSFWTTPWSDKKWRDQRPFLAKKKHMNNSLENMWASVGPKTGQWSDQWRIWYEDRLFIGNFEPTIVWTMVCKRSEPGSQKSSLDTARIRGPFRLVWSIEDNFERNSSANKVSSAQKYDQRSLWCRMVWLEVNLIWNDACEQESFRSEASTWVPCVFVTPVWIRNPTSAAYRLVPPIGRAVVDLVRHFKWSKTRILYEYDHGKELNS